MIRWRRCVGGRGAAHAFVGPVPNWSACWKKVPATDTAPEEDLTPRGQPYGLVCAICLDLAPALEVADR
jgi:hypothetical protein